MTALSARELSPLPLRQQQSIGIILALVIVLAVGAALFVVGWPAAAVLGAFALGTWLVVRPRHGLYAMLASVVIVTGASGLPVVKTATPMYRGIDDLLGPGAVVTFSPLELGMGLMILGTLLQSRHTHSLRLGEFFWPLALLTGILLFGLVRGSRTGGDSVIAFHEIRALLYLLPLYFLTINLVRERRHFIELAAVLGTAVVAMSVGALWTHLSTIRPGELTTALDLTFSHENALFASLIVIAMASMLIWGRGFGPRAILVIPGILGLSAILVMKRRVGVVGLDAGLVLLSLVLLRSNWRMFISVMPILLVAAIIYLGAYWNATGGLGQGARAVRTVIGQEAATEDLSSKRYRERESFNVESNIRWQPFWGSGFGKPYQMPLPLPDLTSFWPFQRYVPHNTILWVWMKGGLLAFIALLTLFGHALLRGMALGRKRLDPLLRAWATVAAASVLIVFLFGWQDLGLTSLRALPVFGFCLGLITVIGLMPEEREEPGEGKAAVQTATRPLLVRR